MITTPTAAEGPLLSARRSQDTTPPATGGSGVCSLEMIRSACAPVPLVNTDWLFDRSGSGVALEALAVLTSCGSGKAESTVYEMSTWAGPFGAMSPSWHVSG